MRWPRSVTLPSLVERLSGYARLQEPVRGGGAGLACVDYRATIALHWLLMPFLHVHSRLAPTRYLSLCDVSPGSRVLSRAMVMQQKTKRPVQLDITEQTRNAVAAWIEEAVHVAAPVDPSVRPDS